MYGVVSVVAIFLMARCCTPFNFLRFHTANMIYLDCKLGALISHFLPSLFILVTYMFFNIFGLSVLLCKTGFGLEALLSRSLGRFGLMKCLLVILV